MYKGMLFVTVLNTFTRLWVLCRTWILNVYWQFEQWKGDGSKCH